MGGGAAPPALPLPLFLFFPWSEGAGAPAGAAGAARCARGANGRVLAIGTTAPSRAARRASISLHRWRMRPSMSGTAVSPDRGAGGLLPVGFLDGSAVAGPGVAERPDVAGAGWGGSLGGDGGCEVDTAGMRRRAADTVGAWTSAAAEPRTNRASSSSTRARSSTTVRSSYSSRVVVPARLACSTAETLPIHAILCNPSLSHPDGRSPPPSCGFH